jgi:hypothetical protein
MLRRYLSPIASIKFYCSLEKEQIALERDRIIAQNRVYTLLFRGIGAYLSWRLTCAVWQDLRHTEERFQSPDRQPITDRLGRAISHLASDKMERLDRTHAGVSRSETVTNLVLQIKN